MSDIDIARSVKLNHITEVAFSLNIDEEDLELYGKYKAKLNYENIINSKKENGKLILVTAINPTPRCRVYQKYLRLILLILMKMEKL